MQLMALYFNKDRNLLELDYKSNILVSKRSKQIMEEDEITQFGFDYFISYDEQVLIRKANELKNKWIEETEDKLKALKNMKVLIKNS